MKEIKHILPVILVLLILCISLVSCQQSHGDMIASSKVLSSLSANTSSVLRQTVSFKDGFYDVGKNIPAGTYKIVAKSDSGLINIKGSNGDLKVYEMFGTSSAYANEISRVVLETGDVIELSNGISADFIPIE